MKQRYWSCFVGILCVFLLVIENFVPVYAAESGMEIYNDHGGSTVCLFMETTRGALAVITSNGSTYFASASTDGETSCFEVYPQGRALTCARACRFGSRIVLLFEDGEQTLVSLASSSGISTTYTLAWPIGAIRGITVDEQNRFWFCSGKELFVCDIAGNLLCSYTLPGAANALATVTGGTVLVFCSDGSTLAADGVSENLYVVSNSGSIPLVMLGSNYFVDAYGVFCLYSGGSIIRTAVTGTAPRTTDIVASAVSGSYAIYADTGSSIKVCRLSDGSTVSDISFDASVKALSGRAVLLCAGTNVYSVAFVDEADVSASVTPTPTSTPTQTPTSTPVPESSPTPGSSSESEEGTVVSNAGELPAGVTVWNTYLEVPCGVTVAQLKRGAEVIDVRAADGSVASGSCRTSMIACMADGKELIIIVPGDANGSGTINTADIKALQMDILGEAVLPDVYRLAADLNKDSKIDTADLVLLAKVIAGG